MADPPGPQLRASDADRERVADVLRHAAGAGQLTTDELDERLDTTYAARTRADLEVLTADLQPAPDAPPAGTYVVRPGPGGAHWLLAILGGCERKGRWRIAERCNVINVMGGSNLDLTEVELASDDVRMRVFSLMGGSEIRLPERLNVDVSHFAVMGGNDIDVGADRPHPGGALLHIRLVSVMGGSKVRRGRRHARRGHAPEPGLPR